MLSKLVFAQVSLPCAETTLGSKLAKRMHGQKTAFLSLMSVRNGARLEFPINFSEKNNRSSLFSILRQKKRI